MKLIVGLGNPGPEYESTRHNIGFMVVERLDRELATTPISWQEQKNTKSLTTRIGDVILAKPLTFMNNSGVAVGALLHYYKLSAGDLWVIHDDIDLPLGKIRIRESGGTGGHHGIESIVVALKTDVFVRFRLGIGRGRAGAASERDKNLHHRSVIQFVLSRFNRHEAGDLKNLVKHGVNAVQMALLDGLDKAQNRYH